MGRSSNSKKKHIPKKSTSKTQGLLIPLRRINELLEEKRYCDNYSKESLIYISIVMEYLISEIMDIVVTFSKARETKLNKIVPSLIVEAIQEDLELSTFFRSKSVCWTDKEGELQIVDIDYQSKARFINKLMFSQNKMKEIREKKKRDEGQGLSEVGESE